MTDTTRSEVDVDQALLDPALVFPSPEALAAHESLTVEQKIEILRRWEYDASEASVATEEGMPGGDGDLLRRILLALSRLSGRLDVEQVGPTKHHGLPRSAAERD
ncbi:hypothetical protein STAQ_36140 [Allostella sp. ATCC 35155]|nr:hypothetical protein STAQ_36140 [Stella sp. ATCC 35155]